MSKLTIGEIEQRLKNHSYENDDDFIKALLNDGRKGVKQLVSRWRNRHEQQRLAREKFIEMSHYEGSLRKQGYHSIAGIDEVGRVI